MRLAKAGLSKKRERVGFGGDGCADTERPNIDSGCCALDFDLCHGSGAPSVGSAVRC